MSRERKKARGKRSAAARTSRAALERALSAAASPVWSGEAAMAAAAEGGSPADILGEAGRLFAAGQYERTAGLLAQALAQTPLSKEAVEMRYVRAASLVQLGDYGEARSEIRRIRDAEPEHPGAALQEIYIEKGEGSTCSEIAHLRQLIAWLEERLAVLAEAGGGQQTSLAVYYRKFLAEAQSLLGSALTLAGEAAAGVRAFLASSRLEADRAQGIAEYSNAVFALNYVPQEERVEFAGLVEDFDAFFPAAVRLPSVSRERVHERLRIGYISPDLRWHPVAFFCCRFCVRSTEGASRFFATRTMRRTPFRARWRSRRASPGAIPLGFRRRKRLGSSERTKSISSSTSRDIRRTIVCRSWH